MKNKGFTLTELLIVVAILGIIAAVLIPNISRFWGSSNTTNNITVTNETRFAQLYSRSITSLNITELSFMVDYCVKSDLENPYLEDSLVWLVRASICQNQIIILQGENNERD